MRDGSVVYWFDLKEVAFRETSKTSSLDTSTGSGRWGPRQGGREGEVMKRKGERGRVGREGGGREGGLEVEEGWSEAGVAEGIV